MKKSQGTKSQCFASMSRRQIKIKLHWENYLFQKMQKENDREESVKSGLRKECQSEKVFEKVGIERDEREGR